MFSYLVISRYIYTSAFVSEQMRDQPLTPQNLVFEVYAYARLKLRHQLLLDVLKKRIIEVGRCCAAW